MKFLANLFVIVPLAFDLSVDAVSAMAAVTASSSTSSTRQGLQYYADALEEMEQDLGKNDSQRHETKLSQHNRHQHSLGGKLADFKQTIVRRKIHRVKKQQKEQYH